MDGSSTGLDLLGRGRVGVLVVLDAGNVLNRDKSRGEEGLEEACQTTSRGSLSTRCMFKLYMLSSNI